MTNWIYCYDKLPEKGKWVYISVFPCGIKSIVRRKGFLGKGKWQFRSGYTRKISMYDA